MEEVTKRLATDESLLLLVDAVKNTETVQQAKTEIQSEGDKQVKKVQDAASEVITDINQLAKNTSDIAALNRNLNSEISRAKEADEILKSRIDTITSLPEGSTTGDAELQDIRVKADGTTATSAGNAVREQFSELKSDLVNLRPSYTARGKIITYNYFDLPFENGYITQDGIIHESTNFKYLRLSAKGIKRIEISADNIFPNEDAGYYYGFRTYRRNGLLYPCLTSAKPNYTLDVPVLNDDYIYLNWFGGNYNNQITIEYDRHSSETDWSDIKWYAMGDSLTDEEHTGSLRKYHDYIMHYTSVQFVNGGLSGTGYKNYYETSPCFYNRISNIPLDTDIVTFFGSFNDIWDNPTIGNIDSSDLSTVCGCINKTLDELNNRLPIVKCGIITPTPWSQYPPYINDSLASQYVNSLIEICKRRGIPYLDLFHCSGLRPWEESYRNICYTNDGGNGTHPNEIGHEIIAHRIYNFMKTLIN